MKAIFYRDWDNSYIPQILEEIYVKKVYKPFVDGKRDLVIADWGSNQGLTVNYFSEYASKVIAVEPSEEHVEVLKELVRFNELKNVEVIQAAVSNENGTTKFYHPENVTMFSMENVMGAKDYEEVETIDVDEFFKRAGVEHLDILKADIEGSESKVFMSPSFIKWAPRIKVILGEHHNWDSQSQDAFANMFKDLGYDFHWRRDTQAAVFEAIRL